jgi:mRNA-degrading endonuclease RelE of RelBE toxin-antitoxin system
MYEATFSDEFKTQLRKLKKKDNAMYERVEKKIRDIIEKPQRFKHLQARLRGEQRVHLGSFILRFRFEENKVFFITFKHHNHAY